MVDVQLVDKTHRLVLLSILFCFFNHAVNLFLTEAALVILDGNLL